MSTARVALLRKLPAATIDKLVQPRFPLDEINEALLCAERQETVKPAIVA